MKARFFLAIFLALLFFSCGSAPGVRDGQVPSEKIETEKEKPPGEGEKGEEEGALRAPDKSVNVEENLAEVIIKIKSDSPDVKKFWEYDDDNEIVVSGKIGPYTVRYDSDGVEKWQDGGGPVFEVPFEVFSAGEVGGLVVARDSLLWKPPPQPKGLGTGLFLGFDDTFYDSWRQYFDLFDKYGVKVTFFVQEYTEFCHEAIRRGHEIGYHTVTHPDLRKVDATTFAFETRLSLEPFVKNGIHIKSFAYPYGFSEPWMRSELASTYSLQRGYGKMSRLASPDDIHAGFIGSKAVDNTMYKSQAAFDAMLAKLFFQTAFLGDGIIASMTTHIIDDNAAWGIKPARLEHLLREAADYGLRFYRYGDFFE
jgi:hypothetical protein